MPDAPAAIALPSAGPALRWRRLAWWSLFVLGNALLATVITLGNVPLYDNPGGRQGLAYLAIALPGHLLAFGALAGALPLLLGLWPRSARTLSISAVLLQGLWLCLLLVDAKVFTLYRFHLNAMVLNMVFGGALQDQVALSWKTWVQVGLLVAAIFTAEGILAWACWKLLPAAPRRRRVLQAWAVVALLMASGQVATAYYDARGDRDVIAQWNYLPWAQPITAKSFMRRLGVVSEQQVGLPDPRHAQLLYPLQPLRCQSPQRPNVLMVVLESLRHDALTPQIMPNTRHWRPPLVSTTAISARATPPAMACSACSTACRAATGKACLTNSAAHSCSRCWASRGTTCICTAARRCTARNSTALHLQTSATSCTRARPAWVRKAVTAAS